MEKHPPTSQDLIEENRNLRERLFEAEQTLEAIRSGEVDALVIQKPDGEQLYTLAGADHGYRVLVESISNGAIILSPEDSIYYCNQALSGMLGFPIQKIIGTRLDSYVASEGPSQLAELIEKTRGSGKGWGEFLMKRNDGSCLPVNISLNYIRAEDFQGICAIVTDLSQQKLVEEELRRRTAELESANKNLRQVPSRLIAAQENERNRLAGDLHDSIGQTLAALKYRIELVITTLERQQLQQSIQLLREFVPILQRSINETRAIYMGLKPIMLADNGILATLEWNRRELLKLYPDQHVELEIAIKEENIPEDVKTPVFRIVQEALNNTSKHSNAEWVAVRLASNNGTIELEIRDDGIGMDLDYIIRSRTAKTLGLIGMRERAALTGGEFTIESTPNEGTTVKVVWRGASKYQVTR